MTECYERRLEAVERGGAIQSSGLYIISLISHLFVIRNEHPQRNIYLEAKPSNIFERFSRYVQKLFEILYLRVT